jgi:hypothetical protein
MINFLQAYVFGHLRFFVFLHQKHKKKQTLKHLKSNDNER